MRASFRVFFVLVIELKRMQEVDQFSRFFRFKMALDDFDKTVAVVLGLGDHHRLSLVERSHLLFGKEMQDHLNTGKRSFDVVGGG